MVEAAYTEFLWRPLFNGLIFFYTALPVQDIGLAIIAFTFAIRIVLLPLFLKGQKAQVEMARIQPELERIRERHKNDREAVARAQMELFREHKVNPFSGCLVMLVQLPILLALFSVFRTGLDPAHLVYLYSFVTNPGAVNPVSFGLIDLSAGNLTLGAVAAVTQFFHTKVTLPKAPPNAKGFASVFQKQMLYLFPIFILFWSRTFPSALILYWTILNILGMLQTVVFKQRSGAGTP